MYNVNEKLVEEVRVWLDACKLDGFNPLDDFDLQDFKEWATMGEHKEMIKLLNNNNIDTLEALEVCVLRIKINGLETKYFDLKDKINSEKANGNLSELMNLKREFDTTFDTFFDQKEIRIKYNDWDAEDETPLFEKTAADLIKLFDEEDLNSYIKFYENYIGELEDELNELVSE